MLTDRDFALIRKSVIATIERRRAQRTFAIRAAGLTLSLIVVFIIAMRMTTQDDAYVAPVHHANLSRGGEAPPPVRTGAAPVLHRTSRPHHHKRANPTPETPMRLELTTADPNVRIIWISTGEETR